MKKFVILISALALMFVPASIASADYETEVSGPGDTEGTAKTSETDEVTLDVLAAIELQAVSDDEPSATAPDEDGTVAASFEASANLRSNLTWAVTSSEVNGDGKMSGAQPLLADLDNLLTGNDGDGRNEDGEENEGENGNGFQEYTQNYEQDVSWGDEAGEYDITLTHTATQTLPG